MPFNGTHWMWGRDKAPPIAGPTITPTPQAKGKELKAAPRFESSVRSDRNAFMTPMLPFKSPAHALATTDCV